MTGKVRLVGVFVDALTRAEVLTRCGQTLGGQRLLHIVTANPEILLRASRSPSYQALLGEADLVLPDGVGLLFAARLRAQRFPERITGVDFLLDLCRIASGAGKRVYLLGGKRRVGEETARRLRRQFPELDVRAFADDHNAASPPPTLWRELAQLRPTILLVAYGVTAQECWIAQHRRRLESLGVRIAMGVGGAFDILSGRLPRAPRWVRASGLEWLWRLTLEPHRLPRVLRATLVFPWSVWRSGVQGWPKKNPATVNRRAG